MNQALDIPVYYLKDKEIDIRSLHDCSEGRFNGHHRHDFFEIIWFTSSAQSCHHIDFKPYNVRKNLIYLMIPGQVHAYTGMKPEGYVILFSRDFFSEIMDERFRLLFNPWVNDGLKIDEDMAVVLQKIVDLMLSENGGQGDVSIMRTYTRAFLLQLSRLNREASQGHDPAGERVRYLFDLLEKGFRTERQAGYYAARMGISPKRLNEILKKKFGVTLTRMLHGRLVLEAKREIAYGRKNMKEIAYELGFNDQAYFSRFFKSQTGMSPESFRREALRAA